MKTYRDFVKYAKERNKKIIQEVILGNETISEIAKKYKLSKNRILQIMQYFNVKSPLRKGTKKYEKWLAKKRKK